MAILSLALKSLLNRRFTVSLILLSIALSVTLLLGVERLRVESRYSFANTISGTDLVVGARSGAINLLLYSVFRIGDATNNISWKSYRKFAKNRLVDWTIPISLGDSHRGYRVMGTNQDYFRYYRYANKRNLAFQQGQPFDKTYHAVLGHEVAQKLNYRIGQKIVIAHVYGHCDFFKNNSWFGRTNRKMMDQMANHATRVRRLVDRYGQDAVEDFLDRALCIENLV
ncbi:MAG: hypothetical protein GY934_02940, partial [Gammaproteobacteria bacterium]|nr:hypothetical protein [Gammaproteobacteria bacterium]